MKYYKALDLKEIGLDNEVLQLLESFQDEYKLKVLTNESVIDDEQIADSSNGQDLKMVIYDFFFEPKFDSVFDLVNFKKMKFGNSKNNQDQE
ncbi:hypothetical protein [Tenacibaculum sp.]|uniref:hypothetical protein n=1 Tax=Tenacibaculum sp. TaxID=1906242 RepID=UPI003D0DBC0D